MAVLHNNAKSLYSMPGEGGGGGGDGAGGGGGDAALPRECVKEKTPGEDDEDDAGLLNDHFRETRGTKQMRKRKK